MEIWCQLFFILLLLFRIFDHSIDGFGSQPITIDYKGSSDCPEGKNNPVFWRGSLAKIGQNKYNLTGEVVFKENVTGPLEVIL